MHLPVPPENDDAAVQNAPAQHGDAKTALVELLESSLGDPNGDGAAGRDGRLDEEGTETAQDPEQAQQAAERAGEAEVPGYAGPFATGEERDALPRDKALLKKLRKSACKNVPASDVGDVLQETLTAACRAPKLPGGSGEDRDKYAFGILRFKIATTGRTGKSSRRSPRRPKRTSPRRPSTPTTSPTATSSTSS
jgi:hypothetical protein